MRVVIDNEVSKKREELEGLNDGKEHTLLYEGRTFEHLRVDSVEIEKVSPSGVGYECKFKIVFSQLRKV
jgi:hypothetical protein